ncbi:MAG: spore coat U domain-containing protein [Armatimonadota bacterium]|nr:spore coat U domain-containing protein [Armatimonadota bacterium]
MKKFLSSLSLGLAVALAWPRTAMAVCTISTTPVSFGNYNVFSVTPLDTTGTVTYRCGTERNIRISLNRGGAATFNPRRMLKGSEALNYNLYRDAARTTIWGDGTGGTQVYFDANPPNNQNVTVNIFGRIPAGQDVTAGSYTNTITATIDF